MLIQLNKKEYYKDQNLKKKISPYIKWVKKLSRLAILKLKNTNFTGPRIVPRRKFPQRKFPRRTVSRMTFPRMTFPRMDISPKKHLFIFLFAYLFIYIFIYLFIYSFIYLFRSLFALYKIIYLLVYKTSRN